MSSTVEVQSARDKIPSLIRSMREGKLLTRAEFKKEVRSKIKTQEAKPLEGKDA